MLRRWIVGTVTSLLGLFALVKGASAGAWLYALSGAALLAVSVWHLARPTRRTLGSIELFWGVSILAYAFASGPLAASEAAASKGQTQGLIFGGILILVGLVNLARPESPPTDARS